MNCLHPELIVLVLLLSFLREMKMEEERIEAEKKRVIGYILKYSVVAFRN